MKVLADNTSVTSRSYYFLLDWNEVDNWEYMRKNFEKEKLCELTMYQYAQLWNHATGVEYRSMLSIFILKKSEFP